MRKARIAANLSQEVLAARCQASGWDVSRGTFAKIEAGLRRVTDAELVVLAKVLRCSFEELIGNVTVAQLSRVLRRSS